MHFITEYVNIHFDIVNTMIGSSCTEIVEKARAGWWKPLPYGTGPSPVSSSLNYSRVCRVTPLNVYGVLHRKLRLDRRIAGGTAEGMPFVPGLG